LYDKPTILDKKNGMWTPAEQNRLIGSGIAIEGFDGKPGRLIAINRPAPGSTFEKILGHSDFTAKMVSRDSDEFRNRWHSNTNGG
jgi:hypothetical protein